MVNIVEKLDKRGFFINTKCVDFHCFEILNEVWTNSYRRMNSAGSSWNHSGEKRRDNFLLALSPAPEISQVSVSNFLIKKGFDGFLCFCEKGCFSSYA